MVAEATAGEPVRVWQVVDAVVGIDTHRDTHTAELAHPSGAPIATCEISNDDPGYAELIGWINAHAPGPRLVDSVEGSRSYGVGLSRALQAARQAGAPARFEVSGRPDGVTVIKIGLSCVS